MQKFSFHTATEIKCESGGLSNLGQTVAEKGKHSVLLITDSGIVKAGIAKIAVSSLQESGIDVRLFDQVLPDPSMDIVRDAAAIARDFSVDLIVGLGGGSSLDVAKIVAVLAVSDQPLEEMLGVDNVKDNRLPLIQVPTTSGTGSEVTYVSVLTGPDNGKRVIYSPQLLPDVALLDASLTLGVPPHVTAATGLDAIVHAVEAYTSRTRKNVISDGLAEKALDLLYSNLPVVLSNPGDLEARENMLIGSMLAGMAFVNASVGAVHGLSLPLGGRFHIPHGHANALLMAEIFGFNLPEAEAEYARLAQVIAPNTQLDSEAKAAEHFVAAMHDLLHNSGLVTRLSELGVTEDAIPLMADETLAFMQRQLQNNPKDMNFEDICQVYRAAL